MAELILLLVSSNDDFIIVKKGSCLNCTQNKTNSEIFKAWDISTKSVMKGIKNHYFTKKYNIKCECDNYIKIKSESLK